MKPIHVNRYDRSRQHFRKRKPQAPAREYQAGHFTELVRRYDWPPNFKPTIDKELAQSARSLALSQNAANAREIAATNGTGWGLGTVIGISDAADKRAATIAKPDWMGERK